MARPPGALGRRPTRRQSVPRPAGGSSDTWPIQPRSTRHRHRAHRNHQNREMRAPPRPNIGKTQSLAAPRESSAMRGAARQTPGLPQQWLEPYAPTIDVAMPPILQPEPSLSGWHPRISTLWDGDDAASSPSVLGFARGVSALECRATVRQDGGAPGWNSTLRRPALDP